MNKIIAIVGMCGSGKSIASEYYEKLLTVFLSDFYRLEKDK